MIYLYVQKYTLSVSFILFISAFLYLMITKIVPDPFWSNPPSHSELTGIFTVYIFVHVPLIQIENVKNAMNDKQFYLVLQQYNSCLCFK